MVMSLGARKEAAAVATTAASEQLDSRVSRTAEPLLVNQFLPPAISRSCTRGCSGRHPSNAWRRWRTSTSSRSRCSVCSLAPVGYRSTWLVRCDAKIARRGIGCADLPAAGLPSIGWMLLGERPGAELVFGQVGKPWKLRGSTPTDPVTPAGFAAFGQPDFAKLVESTRIDPDGERLRP